LHNTQPQKNSSDFSCGLGKQKGFGLVNQLISFVGLVFSDIKL
jgi:hypothetical protein